MPTSTRPGGTDAPPIRNETTDARAKLRRSDLLDRVMHRTDGVTLLSIDGCVVFVMRQVPTAVEIRMAESVQESVLQSTNGELAWLNVMAWRFQLQDGFERDALPVANRLYRRPGRDGVGLANVLLCGPLAAPVARTILRTALVIAQPKYPVHVGMNLERACTWLEARAAARGRLLDHARLNRGTRRQLRESVRPGPSEA
ncbi:MAG: hypothetical protein AB8I08_21935 [Sandaracinaceae bacterium]